MKGGDDDTAERTAELENFHAVLQDVSMGLASERTRRFIAQAYVRGTLYCGTADNAELEGNTAVFTKRRLLTRQGRVMHGNHVLMKTFYAHPPPRLQRQLEQERFWAY